MSAMRALLERFDHARGGVQQRVQHRHAIVPVGRLAKDAIVDHDRGIGCKIELNHIHFRDFAEHFLLHQGAAVQQFAGVAGGARPPASAPPS